jgi:hypothetical protein
VINEPHSTVRTTAASLVILFKNGRHYLPFGKSGYRYGVLL